MALQKFDYYYYYYYYYYTVSRKSEPLKDFATTSVNLHQIKYILSHDTYVLKFLENSSYPDWEIKL